MHQYTTDIEKTGVYKWIAFISVFLAWVLSYLLKLIQIEILWIVDAPSVVGFYGILYKLFDTRLWRWKVFNNIPDLSGQWQGKVSSTHDKFNNEHPASIIIKQTWSHISIILTTENSRSESCVLTISTKTPDGAKIHYAYENKPRHNAVSTMKRHDGTANLILKEKDGKLILEGDYYTGRDRKNHGILHFEKQSLI